MAFKKMVDYNKDRYDSFFILRNDGDSANVAFLYQSIDDVLVADAHYINSADYTGYIHCCGRGCPACAAGIRVQKKLFIPLYNFDSKKIEFFDRNIRFEQQLNDQVFARFPDPSKYVFTITRHGKANDVNTTYDISIAGRNTTPILSILAQENMTLPEGYDKVIREFSAREVATLINNRQPRGTYNTMSDLPDYSVTPRAVSNAPVADTESTSNDLGIDIPDNLPEFDVTASDNSADDFPADVDFNADEIPADAPTSDDIDDVDF